MGQRFAVYHSLRYRSQVVNGVNYIIEVCGHMWQTQVENEHYSTVSGLI